MRPIEAAETEGVGEKEETGATGAAVGRGGVAVTAAAGCGDFAGACA